SAARRCNAHATRQRNAATSSRAVVGASLGRRVLRLEPRDCHVADVAGSHYNVMKRAAARGGASQDLIALRRLGSGLSDPKLASDDAPRSLRLELGGVLP